MGCDIHTCVEVKRCINKKEIWVDANYYKKNPYYDGVDEDEKEYEVVEICGERNYQRFSVLANVRNYGNTKPIAEPKGIPTDCCESIKKEYESWGDDAHSASYFTLKELIEYQNNNPIVKYSGLISQESARELDENGVLPQSWCQGTSDNTYVKRSWSKKSEVIIPVIEKLKKRLCEHLYICDTDDRINEFSERIRIVFWFDN